MTHPILYKVAASAAGASGLLISQIPTQTELGEWSKLGFSGACLAIALLLVTKTIPSILASHREASEVMRKGMDEGFSELKDSIDKGNDRVATLLQSTLVQAFRDKRDQQ